MCCSVADVVVNVDDFYDGYDICGVALHIDCDVVDVEF